MALTETTTTKSITTNKITNEIFVIKETKIFRDSDEVATTTTNRYFNQTEKADFLLEVEGAENYITAMGW